MPAGPNAGQEIRLLIDRETLPYSQLNSFDQLPIRFRCVATHFVSGILRCPAWAISNCAQFLRPAGNPTNWSYRREPAPEAASRNASQSVHPVRVVESWFWPDFGFSVGSRTHRPSAAPQHDEDHEPAIKLMTTGMIEMARMTATMTRMVITTTSDDENVEVVKEDKDKGGEAKG